MGFAEEKGNQDTKSANDVASSDPPRPQVGTLSSHLKDAVIMLVDDEPIIMGIVQTHLELAGYKNFIQTAKSEEAIDILKQELPDILLLDLKMPGVSGFDILQEVRSSEELRYLPVIVLSSSRDHETMLKSLDIGATDFLSKPVGASELALRLRNTLAVKAYQDQLTYYDTLTHLPNRDLFLDRLTLDIEHAMREDSSVAILNISLTRFKEINESIGPHAGDELLLKVSKRLLKCVRQSDVISRLGQKDQSRNFARWGGDEFSVYFTEISSVGDVAFVAARLIEGLQKSFMIADNEVFVSAGIGVAVHPQDGTDANALIKHACTAAEYAKKNEHNDFQFYSKDINALSKWKLSIESALRRALEREEFTLHYQPKIDAKSVKVIGAEALIRWERPNEGMVQPDHFIPIAEEKGLIVPIGEWVMHEACRQAKAWQETGLNDLVISVNVSGHQIRQKNICQVIQSALDKSGLDPKHLLLEITESTLMTDVEHTIETLHMIRDIGARFSIDDFGTGYSSLSYLQKFPLDELKIDRSFVVDVPQKKDDSAIIRSIIALAHALKLKVVAEGIETVQQFTFLCEEKCDVIQGYYFGRPMPSHEFEKYVMDTRQ